MDRLRHLIEGIRRRSPWQVCAPPLLLFADLRYPEAIAEVERVCRAGIPSVSTGAHAPRTGGGT